MRTCLHKFGLLGLIPLIFGLISGCESAHIHPSDELGFARPEQWHPATSDHTPITPWLESFADSTLSQLVEQGLNQNFDLLATAARVDAARATAKIAGANRLPQFYFAPGYQRSKTAAYPESGSFDALFTLSWELDVWGRIQAAQQASSEDATAVLEDYQAARLSLAARIAQVYFELTEAQLQEQVARQSVKDRGVIVELVRGRFNKGLTRGLDLRLTLTDLANAQSQLAQTQNDVQGLQKQLDSLLGRYPGQSPNPLSISRSLPAPPKQLASGLPAQLIDRRPDVVAAYRRLVASDRRLESSQKALLPRFTLTAAGGISSPALTEIIDPRAAAWNVAAGLAQPLFTGERLESQIRLSEANVEEAFHRYQSVALNAFREVEQALAAENYLREKEQALKEAVAQTEASRKLAVYSYRQGLIEILTLLDSYRSTLYAQSAHLAVQRQLLNNRISLYLALGGAV